MNRCGASNCPAMRRIKLLQFFAAHARLASEERACELCRTKRREYRALRPSEERFWPKVDKYGPTMPGMESCCWVWTATRMPHGYGRFGRGGKYGGVELAHRRSWILSGGADPAGLIVCHRCDNPSCVRPDHLFLGTQLDNMGDCSRKGRIATGDRSWSRLHMDRLPRGERCHLSKLTDAKVREIRARLTSGESQRSIAKSFGVIQQTISFIARGTTWSHVK